MLSINVGEQEALDESTSEFVMIGGYPLELEHSLASLSKWESKWETQFLSDKEKTNEQTLDYVRCMTITPGVPPDVFNTINNRDITRITEYINSKMTGTTFSSIVKAQTGKKETISAEIIYYWMVSLNIPLEWENRHLNQLLTLVRVINEKNAPAKKKSTVSKSELIQQRRALNEQRRRQLNTSG
jgi:hypothetical protein